MTSASYQKLIRDYCVATGITNIEETLQRPCFRIGETALEVSYREILGAGQILLLAYFPAVSAHNPSVLAERLLNANFMLQVLGIPLVWSVNPRTSQIVATDNIQLEGMTTPLFAARLAYFSQTAHEWGDRVLEQHPDDSWLPDTKPKKNSAAERHLHVAGASLRNVRGDATRTAAGNGVPRPKKPGE